MENIIKHITSDIKALIFDLDGTLADTIPLHLKAWQSAANAFGVEVTDDMIMQYSGTPTVIVAEYLGNKYNWNIDPKKIAAAKMEFYHEHKKKTGKVKAIEPILKIAQDYHLALPLAVGTGSTRNGALKSLEDIEATHLFDIIVTATDVKHPKPHPETFLKSAEFFGVSPQECIVFEDGASGIKAAIEGGFKLVDVNPYLAK